MAKGCLAALFGIGLNAPASGDNSRPTNGGPNSGGMTEGDVHSGPGGYEGMGYSGGYAADYRADKKREQTGADSVAPSAAAIEPTEDDSSGYEAGDYGFDGGEA
jgi:hypothetical protein